MNEDHFGAEQVPDTALALRLFELGELDLWHAHAETGLPIPALLSWLRNRPGCRIRGYVMTLAWYTPDGVRRAILSVLQRRATDREDS